MDLLATIKIALRALTRNKMRSILTMLGIIIGVGAVIAMVGIGQGASASIQSQIAQLGNNMLYVQAGSTNSGGMRGGSGSGATLTAEDVEAIARECPAVKLASPGVRANGQLVFGNQNWYPSGGISGANEQFPDIRLWKIGSGAFFTDVDVRSSNRVAVLGQTVVDNLFSGGDPVGQTIRIRNLPFQVVGVLSPKGQNQYGQDQDDVVVIPYTAAQKKLLSITYINNAMISASSPAATYTAQKQITDLLRQRHKLLPNQEDDFTVRNLTDVADAATESSKIMTSLLASVAGVSLMVGGIGIMNIMLVSVTERTREIGIRMAIGARGGAIRRQFLIESVTLSLVGGIIGVFAGLLASVTISHTLNWPTLVSPASIVVSVIFSVLVGVGFGYYPARKAAALDPIDALRYE
ncbi:MAG: putative transport system permease protein [Blastocatellia bacterium]|jgi:putative ABC transport system permease protein|nr:putative transport system permease protein [Blastocatellia bacterium]